MKVKVTVHLINEQTIEYEETWFLLERLENKMNDGNSVIHLDKYIVPKSSINYIECKEVESEGNNEN